MSGRPCDTLVAIALTFGAVAAAVAEARAADVEPLKSQVLSIIDHLTVDCRYDLETYCSTVTPGEGRLAFCLMAHAGKRSSRCELGLAKARQEAEQIVGSAAQACEPDISKLCNGTEPGEGRIVQCLLEQKDALSESCSQVADVVERVVFPASNQPIVSVPSLGEASSVADAGLTGGTPAAPSSEEILEAVDAKVLRILGRGKEACEPDLEKYCSTVEPGEGRLVFCLVAHADKRSDACEAAIDEARSEAEEIINDVDEAIAACAPDIEARCGGTEPGEGRIAQCLMEQRDALGATCGTLVDKLANVIFPPSNRPAAEEPTPDAPVISTEERPAARPPVLDPAVAVQAALSALEVKVQAMIEKGKDGCAEDLESYCSTVTPGEGRLAFCLIAHADKRSAKCESALAAARGEAELLIGDVNNSIEACAPDIAALCSGTDPGEGRIAVCLAEQRESLTEACGGVMDRLANVIFPPRNDAAASAGISTGVVDAGLPPKEQTCKWLSVSVKDWGQDGTKRDARSLLKSRAEAFAANNGIQDFKFDGGYVKCKEEVNIVVSGYYSCRAQTQVCWTPIGGEE